MTEQLNNHPNKESFMHETARIENEPRIEANSHYHHETEARSAQRLAEADKAIEDANAEADNQKVLAQLETAQKAPEPMTHGDISRAQRNIAKRRGLKQLREKESAPERTLSKVIHQPFVRTASEAAGKTVTRPSGLLGGGLVAFLGSGSYLVLAKTIHFSYNYSVSLALFVGGFIFGLALELLVHMSTASHRQVD